MEKPAPVPTESFTLRHIQGLLFFCCLTAVLLLSRETVVDWPRNTLFLSAAALGAAALAFTSCASRRGIFSVPFMYLLVFSLFHMGLFLAYGLGLETPKSGHYLLSASGQLAVLLVAIGASAYCAGVSAAAFFGAGPTFPMESSRAREFFGVAGFLLAAGGVAAWFAAAMLAGGPGVFRVAYLDFLEITDGAGLGLMYYVIGLGMVLLAAAEPCLLRRLGFAAFALFAVVAFPLGLRGEVLYPVTAALAVIGKRKRPFSTGKAVVLVVVVLCSITAVRYIRDFGVGGIATQKVSLAPGEALAEMGASIRPVVEVIRWRASGEPLLYGQSYWAPFDRALIYLLPGWTRPAAHEDDRLLNVLVQRRVGPIGFSVVAEAYRNLAAPGVAMVMFATGFLLGRLDRWPATLIGQAITGIILLPCLAQIRNAFTQVPMQILVGLLALAVIVWLSRFSRTSVSLHKSDGSSPT